MAFSVRQRHATVRGRRVARWVSALAMIAATGAVQAADGPRSTPHPRAAMESPPPPPAEFDWSGFYVGAHAGFGLDHFGFKYAVAAPGAAFDGTSGITANGPLAGVHAGFNYQLPLGFMPGSIVAGLEIANSWTGIQGEITASGVPASSAGSATFGSKLLNFGTASYRFGYAYGPFLFYMTRGLTYGVIDTTYRVHTSSGFYTSGSDKVVRSGTPLHVGVVGVGVEYVLSPNWTIRGEYLYEGIIANYKVFTADGSSIGFGTRTMYHIGRIGLSYKFDWVPPPLPPLSSLF